MIKFPIKSWITGEVKFTAEIDCDENAAYGVKIGLSVLWGIQHDADLAGSDLTNARLTNADLTNADLTNADLAGSDLTNARLTYARLTYADLTNADLRSFKADLWMILTMSKSEVPFLINALEKGLVDGSTYEGDCACLVGTLKKNRSEKMEALPQVASSPAEQWFSMIKKGDKPTDKSGGGYASRMALE